MRRRRKLPKKRKIKTRGRGIPYIYKNRIYFGKKPQNNKTKRKRKKNKKYGKGFADRFKLLYSLGKQWCNSIQ